MGDKTQLLAMAFACKFRWQTVMWGVLAATAANHLGAAYAGNLFSAILPIVYIKIAAAVSFIIFGLWTIRGDSLQCEDKRYNFSPFWTVTIAFFMAEMGDKTQLATIALAVEYNTVINVWIGTTIGMLISNAIGIIFVTVLGKHLPERAIKWFAALIFIAFGMVGLYQNTPKHIWNIGTVAGLIIILGSLIYITASQNAKGKNHLSDYARKETSKTIFNVKK